jgi:MraZ protein
LEGFFMPKLPWGAGGGKWVNSGERWLKKGKSGVKWGITQAVEPGFGRALSRGSRWAAMFLGTHEPRLDEKGRLILPAKFREELSAGLVITKGQERCLYVFPSQEFSEITQTLKQAPVTAKSARDYSRVMFAGAHDEIPDRQGRVTIPQALRTYAGLEKDCVVIGANTRVEIWDSNSWNEYLADREKSFAEVSEEVFPGLF